MRDRASVCWRGGQLERGGGHREEAHDEQSDVVTALCVPDELPEHVLDGFPGSPEFFRRCSQTLETFVDRLSAPLDEPVRVQDERRAHGQVYRPLL